MHYVVTILLCSFMPITFSSYSLIPAFSIFAKCLHQDQRLNRPYTQTLTVRQGQLFTIALEGKHSTGYTWYISDSFLEEYVQLLEKVQLPYRMPGGRTRTIFRFQALKEGQQIITFQYARPWNWHVMQEHTYIINICNTHRCLPDFQG